MLGSQIVVDWFKHIYCMCLEQQIRNRWHNNFLPEGTPSPQATTFLQNYHEVKQLLCDVVHYEVYFISPSKIADTI